MAASTTSTVVKEPTFEVSNFESPREVDNADMWIKLICELIFLEKGTYSDEPDCGVHIAKYAYNDLIEDSSILESEIKLQVGSYLADIPIGTLSVKAYYWEERNIYILRVLVGFVEGSVITYRTIDINDENRTLSYIISKFDEK